MRSVWQFDGNLFASQRAAQRAKDAHPKNWGSLTARPGTGPIREVKLFDTAEEWASYTGCKEWLW